MKKIVSLLFLSVLIAANVQANDSLLKNIQNKAENYALNIYYFFGKKVSDSYSRNAYESAKLGSYVWAAKNIFKYGMNKTAPKANQQTFGTMPNRLFRYSHNISAKVFPVTMITSLGFSAADMYNKWKNA
jgi:hypothetical protein